MTEALIEREKPSIKFEDDPLFSVIVPIYDLEPLILKRCLMSIENQDYENLEVVLVLDGPNDKLRKTAEYFTNKFENWSLHEIEHQGACAARNAGYAKSKGDILAFINSDYVLKPGILRLWVDRLQENPDCGFLYGAYQYNTTNSFWYPSRKFDPYLLNVANYIDCGFPLWRKYFVPWDVNCKSLQDWDFWIRVVKTHNVKGFYLERDISFIAEPPRPKGLSDDSANNWIERVQYVKNKNEIKSRDLVVTSIGAPNHGVEIAKCLKADYRDDTITKPNTYKAVYMIGFYLHPGQRTNEHGEILGRFKKDVKKIIHWVGADIFWLRKFSYENLKALGGALKLTAINLVENENAKAELKDLLGVDSEVVPIPPYNDYEVKPLPEKFKVALFLTDQSNPKAHAMGFDKYLLEHSLSIVRAMPDIQFTGYGDYATKQLAYPNLECVGNLSKEKWKEYVYGNSCLLRLARHDTTPLASNEFMMAGRSVISNIPGECTHLIDTSGDSEINKWDKMAPGFNAYRWPDTKKKIVQTIRSLKGNKTPYVDTTIQTRFDREKYIETIYKLAQIERPQS